MTLSSLPTDYRSLLTLKETQKSIKDTKLFFEQRLSDSLDLERVSAPLFVLAGTGINDDLNGIERPVSFAIKSMNDQKAEVVHSLAKWKRMKLGEYEIPVGSGLYTDMNAIRADEELDHLHSLYVDQWDWERTIRKEDRTLEFLRTIVQKIYDVIRETEKHVHEVFPQIEPCLPQGITFIHTEQLQQEYPTLTPPRREYEAAKKYGAIFVVGIGGKLADGVIHDGRAPDYDDWSTETGNGLKGLNGDIVVWNPVLESQFEISSMGIRVDREALLRQLEIRGCTERTTLGFHKALLEDRIPLSIGGGIGQSRLCMFLLRKAHIGEVQASLWPEEMIIKCQQKGISLL